MATALLLPPQLEKFLVVGLGGAALPHFLLHHFPAGSLTIVEKERIVIELGYGYFRLPLNDRIRIVHQDAVITSYSIHYTKLYDCRSFPC